MLAAAMVAPPRPRRLQAFDLAVAGLAGGLHTAAFAPVEAWWLQIAALALLAWRLPGLRPAKAGWLGLAFGSVWLCSGLWWLFISMYRYGGLPAPLAALAVALLSLALSIYLAVAMALWARWRSGRVGVDAALFAALWLAAELARARWFTGFPWLASGYAHTSGPLAAWAPWIGVYGIGALAAALAACIAWVLLPAAAGADRPGVLDGGHRPGWLARGWPLGLGLAVVALAQALPAAFTTPTGSLSVSLLQPNVAQDLKFDSQRMAENFERLARDIESARGDLVVTPESVVPLPLAMIDPAQWQRLQRAVSQPGRSALVGIFTGDDQQGYVNSMLALSAATDGTGPQAYRYGKQHLLPFGEFIPPGFGWFVRTMRIPLDDQASGHNSQPWVMGSQRLRPLICYEDLFGEDIVASAVGEAAATIFVNASNLAWFGTHMVQDQHLQFSRMRALEFQRPFVRATNTGATTVIDHQGRVTARLPAATQGVLEAQVQGRSGSTPYGRWLHALGLWPLWALALGVAGLSATRGTRQRRR